MNNLPRPARAKAVAQPLTLHVCFQSLQSRPERFQAFLRTWFAGWAILLSWSVYAFLVAPSGIAFSAQAAFFAVLFPWILLPFAAALGRKRCNKR
ncbi:MAG: hypothetical protein KGQ75_14495 [Sphingomonadales bacterium]|uniref:hypothetical protein n=1 Tax=Novosphingobium sp. NDB2Meth1 TaxID=1892847 RepID=UPI000931E15F|nr:hypothetical protein [Novosphingobium sp. NDB2Meth1]MBU6395775.1 hypothetical protein [Sphingomonadales bacterium]MBY0391832.1 hypothetical protein [Novosphingobium sp.]